MDLYDEFGNYVGPEAEESDVEEEELEEELEDQKFRTDFDEDDEAEENDYGQQQLAILRGSEGQVVAAMDVEDNRIVLHEDKKYYPDAEEVYPGVKTVVLDEDAQELNEPIIKPVKQKNFSVLLKEPPKLKYEAEFMTGLMQTPTLIRNIAILGHLHHGKTLFTDILVQASQEIEWDAAKEMKYSDIRKDEQERKLSIKSTAITLVLEDLKEKSYLFNILDCPGHSNFSDEATAAIRAVDGCVLVVDAIEGIMLQTERHIHQILAAGLEMVLVINKMDRLILELKLPPQDAYFKLQQIIEEVNRIITSYSATFTGPKQPKKQGIKKHKRISPELGNVCFASGQHGWVVSLESFASMYIHRYYTADATIASSGKAAIASKRLPFTAQELAKRLWGDWYLDNKSHSLTKTKPATGAVRSFVAYILEPLYKLYAQIIGESFTENLKALFASLQVKLKKTEYHLDPIPLLKVTLRRFFGMQEQPRGFVQMIIQHLPSPLENAQRKVQGIYTGRMNSMLAKAMYACYGSILAPFVGNVMKLYNTPDGSSCWALTRIYAGVIHLGDKIQVLGESYHQEENDEDAAIMEVTGISVSVGRFFIEVNSATAGNLVLLHGIDGPIKKTATLVSLPSQLAKATMQSAEQDEEEDEVEIAIFRPLQFDTASVMKLAIEPFIPSELPKMVEALRRVNKTYPLVTTKVEESGEHILLGTGELYLDCIMHDLRYLYSDIEMKVADPVVCFAETVAESSSINCLSETPNHKNSLTMLAEPLDDGLMQDIEKHHKLLPYLQDSKAMGEFFTSNYHWDLLTARSIWAFGPEDDAPNMLLNNTLPSEVNQRSLQSVKESIIQGFKWGTREGPLCDEPIRNVKFRLLDATIAQEPIYRGGGQVIPTARRAVYSSFLLGTPRMMEPMYLVEIQAPADCVQAVYPVLARRRGHVVQDAPKPGAPFYTVKAYLPVMDSFGFETDLRSYTLGQVFCQQVFDHWAVVPGDPLDKNVILHPLEPSPPLALARDFMVKTRRRKGLSEDVSINKYLDDAMLMRLAKHEADLGALM